MKACNVIDKKYIPRKKEELLLRKLHAQFDSVAAEQKHGPEKQDAQVNTQKRLFVELALCLPTLCY